MVTISLQWDWNFKVEGGNGKKRNCAPESGPCRFGQGSPTGKGKFLEDPSQGVTLSAFSPITHGDLSYRKHYYSPGSERSDRLYPVLGHDSVTHSVQKNKEVNCEHKAEIG